MLLHQGCEPTDSSNQVQFEALIRRLVDTVPLWRMECTKDPQAAVIARNTMSNQ